MTGTANYQTSKTTTSLLQASLLQGTSLCANEHRREAAIGRHTAKAHLRSSAIDALDVILTTSTPMDKRRIKRLASTGAWLTTMPNLLNGSALSAEEFRDGLRLRLGLQPTALPPLYDGCGERFTTEHAMSCRKGGLILHRHNDLVTSWGQLCGQAHTPSSVSDEPLIQPSRNIPVEGTTPTEPSPKLRGNLAVHGFWTRSQTAIFDVRITDTDQPSNQNTDPAKVLLRHEKEKKNKYGALCIERRRTITDTDQPSNQNTDPAKVLLRHEKEKKNKYGALCIERRRTFTPLVFSIDGLLGKEAKAATNRLASSLAANWKRSYSEVCGFVRSRISLALIRSSSRCLRADCNPSHRFQPPVWDSGTGLGLYRM